MNRPSDTTLTLLVAVVFVLGFLVTAYFGPTL